MNLRTIANAYSTPLTSEEQNYFLNPPRPLLMYEFVCLLAGFNPNEIPYEYMSENKIVSEWFATRTNHIKQKLYQDLEESITDDGFEFQNWFFQLMGHDALVTPSAHICEDQYLVLLKVQFPQEAYEAFMKKHGLAYAFQTHPNKPKPLTTIKERYTAEELDRLEPIELMAIFHKKFGISKDVLTAYKMGILHYQDAKNVHLYPTSEDYIEKLTPLTNKTFATAMSAQVRPKDAPKGARKPQNKK